jgi:hypothetical protein
VIQRQACGPDCEALRRLVAIWELLERERATAATVVRLDVLASLLGSASPQAPSPAIGPVR